MFEATGSKPVPQKLTLNSDGCEGGLSKEIEGVAVMKATARTVQDDPGFGNREDREQIRRIGLSEPVL